LRYYGDRCSFSLAAQQVTDTGFSTNNRGLNGVFTRLVVGWREDPDATTQFFTLETRDAVSQPDMRRRAEKLRQRIESLRSLAAGSGALETHLGLPPIPTSTIGVPLPQSSPRRLAADLTAFVLALAVIAACVAG